MMQLILIVLTKRKEMTCYCELFGYGGKCALDKCFYRSNEIIVPAENGSNISIEWAFQIVPLVGFSLTS
jgi:hypothetical protein